MRGRDIYTYIYTYILKNYFICVYMCVHVLCMFYVLFHITDMLLMLSHFSHVQLFVTPWTAAYQAPPVHGIFQARVLEWGAMEIKMYQCTFNSQSVLILYQQNVNHRISVINGGAFTWSCMVSGGLRIELQCSNQRGVLVSIATY